MSHATISISELADLLRDPACVILDTRPSAAYVGWQLNDEARGGHIPGSVNFPLAWIIKYSCEQLNPILQSQGATPDKSIVIYGYRDDRNSLMIDWLRILGFANIIILESGLEEWAADFSLPMEYLPNYEKLVHAQWVDDCFFSRNNLHSQSEKAMLFEVISDGIENYKAGHIPGALPMDLSLFENAPDWNLCRDEDLLEALLSLGIASDTLVVLYGKDPMAAARAAYILLYAGVEDVRILDGGFDAWKSFGGSIEVEVQQPTPIKSFGYEVPVRPNLLIGIDQTKSIIKEDNGVLVSVRSWAEFTGETSGYDFIGPKGRIAGAVWGHSGSDPNNLQDFRNLDSTMRSYHAIAANWRSAGIVPKKRVAFYCGTGWRASEAFFCAYLMGWENIAVYDGGWLEWSLDGSNPVEVGIPTA